MDRIEKLIKMLESPKASTRYDACEWLRVAPSLNDAALAALERVSNDPDPEVRDAAQRALDLHRAVRKTDATPDYVTLSCPSCGGELAIAGDIDRFACTHCGAEQVVTAPSAPSRIAGVLGSFAVLAGCGLLLWALRSTGRSHEIYAYVIGGRLEACCL